MRQTTLPQIAYLSMEIALEPRIPTYAGGLGVLAGDTLRSAADLGLPMVAVTLVHRHGYFAQELDAQGRQLERPEHWDPDARMERVGAGLSLPLAGRNIAVRAYRSFVRGEGGARVPVYLLDTDLPENNPEDRRLTDSLYGGSDETRLLQEAILGIGAIRLLAAEGYALEVIHMNEGHAALAALALLEERSPEPPADPGELAKELASLRRACVFTTHTPLPAGHDRFPIELARAVLGDARSRWLAALGQNSELHMTELALASSHFVNGVALRHGEVSRGLFPEHAIHAITNGIHPATWASAPMRSVFDRHLPDWRRDPLTLRYAIDLPKYDLAWAHGHAKRALVERVNAQTGAGFGDEALTLGFARRATGYKRAGLILADPERLAALAAQAGGLQLVFAGKAHPRDTEGKDGIARIHDAASALRGRVSIAYLPNYDMEIGALLVAGCDVWLNNPVPPLEASGTSGMKAALNGVPSLSTLDGWWIEGCIEGVTGWAIGSDARGLQLEPAERDRRDADALCRKLADAVIPTYCGRRDHFQDMMRWAIALNAAHFNTHRMLLQYLVEAYRAPAA